MRFRFEMAFMEKKILILASLIILAGLFLNLGTQPLYLEEPRRTMVAMEMVENGNLIVPTQLGAFYYKKPPGFNWVLIASATLFGGFNEFAMRLPTVLSTIGIGVLLFLIGRRYVSEDFSWLSALLFICGGAIFFYFSSLAEIDLFYSLITFGSFMALFHFYQKEKWWVLFLLTYGLGAFGTLTKSLPSVLFTGLSILAYFLYKRNFKKLISPMHLAGMLLYLLIVGGYLYAYSRYNGLTDYFANILGDSTERTMLEKGFLSLVSHIFTFPLDILIDILPASFLLLFLIRRDIWQLVKSNELITFSAIVFLVNIPVYWLSPGARQRYIYMLYPLLVMIFTYAYINRSELAVWREKTFRVIVGSLITITFLGGIALNFIPDFQFLPYLLPLSIIVAVVSGGIFYFYLKQPNLSMALLLLTLGLCRIIFDLTILPQRAYKSGAAQDKSYAEKIDSIVGDDQVYVLKDSRFSFTTVVYLNKLREETLKLDSAYLKDAYYITNDTLLPPQLEHESFFKFDYHGQQFSLIKFE